MNYDQPVSINTYGITASKNEPTRDPSSWTLEGSNDGEAWTLLDSRSAQSFSHRYATQFYTADATEPYSKYRFTITATGGATQIQIGELQLLNLEEDETAIRSAGQTSPQLAGQNVYDLSGRKVSDGRTDNLRHGIYIMGGKKILK